MTAFQVDLSISIFVSGSSLFVDHTDLLKAQPLEGFPLNQICYNVFM